MHWQKSGSSRGGKGYTTTGTPYSPPAPYQVWFAIWRALLNLTNYDEPSVAKTKLALWFAENLPQHTQGVVVFQNLLGLEQQEPGELLMLEAATRQKIVFDTLVAMLEAHAQQAPLLLIFEYLDFVDSISIHLLQQLPVRLQNLPVLICLEGTNAPAGWLNQLTDAETIALENWSQAEALDYLKSQLPAEVVERTQRLLPEKTAPADLHTLLTLHKRLPNHRFATLEEASARLMEQFSAPEQAVIAQKALWGMTFPAYAPWLNSSQPILQKSTALGITERFWDANELLVWDRFRRSSLREAFIKGIAPQAKQETYQQVIQFVQTYLRGSTRAALLAPFVDPATSPVSATQWHIMAGDHARRWGAEKEALDHYLTAEGILEKQIAPAEGTPLRIALLLGRASLYYHQQAKELGIADTELARRTCRC